MYSSELFSPELLWEKFENDLEISGKTQGIESLRNMAALLLDSTYQTYQINELFSPIELSLQILCSSENEYLFKNFSKSKAFNRFIS